MTEAMINRTYYVRVADLANAVALFSLIGFTSTTSPYTGVSTDRYSYEGCDGEEVEFLLRFASKNSFDRNFKALETYGKVLI